MDKLERMIGLIEYSTERLTRGLKLPIAGSRQQFLKKEAWVHFKRSAELVWFLYHPRWRGRRRR